MRIDHINIVVEDIILSQKFYIEVLGFEKTLELELNQEWMSELTGFESPKAKCVFLETSTKNCRIELLEYISPEILSNENSDYKLNKQGIRHIALEVDNIDEIYSKAKEKGIEFISKPIQVPLEVVASGKVLCYLKAPDGVIIELAQYKKVDDVSK